MTQVERKEAVSDLEQKSKDPQDEASIPDESSLPESEATEQADDPDAVVDSAGNEAEVSDIDPVSEEELSADEVTPQPVDSEAESKTVPAEATVEDVSEVNEEALSFFRELIPKARDIAGQHDWAFISSEFANLSLQAEQQEVPRTDEIKAIMSEFETLRDEFEQRRKAHYEELNRRKEENLAKKKELLKQFGALVEEQRWTDTREVGQIRNAWEQIKVLPADQVDALNERFESLMKEFESHKVDRLVKKLQKEEENLTLKLVILDKIDKLNKGLDEGSDFSEKSNAFDDLLTQWRKIGRVPAEKNQEIWNHFNEAQDAFNDLRFKYDKNYRESVEQALSKKQKLVKEAEALVDMDNIAQAARKVNKLHRAWKKTGNLPQKDENELWDKFKAATDAFNDKKTDNIDVLRDQEQENLDKKMLLIEKAAEFSEAEDFDAGHSRMQQLMEDWKKIGPVPRKKSSKIWKQFKKEMDAFYERRRDHFKDVRKDYKDNLEKKKEIIAQLEALKEHSDPVQAVEEAKKLQQAFKDAGHVPIKHKNKIWKDYREVCDVIYDNLRSSGTDRGMERKLASEGVEPGNRKKIIKLEKEIDSLQKENSRMESEIIQFKEAKTYFKPTNKGNKLIEELQQKIEKAEGKVDKNKEKISSLRADIREMMKESADDSGEEE